MKITRKHFIRSLAGAVRWVSDKPYIAGAVLCLATALVFPQAPSARRFPIPGHGELLLQVPGAWRDAIRQPQDNLPPTIVFTPAEGSPFKVMVTAGGFSKPGATVMDADTLQRQVEMLAKDTETQSIEKSLAIKELSGPECRGFYFSATDKAPKAGEFTHMMQGIARTGDILIAFTVLTHDGQEAVIKAALDMLRGAMIRSDSGL